MKAIALSLVLSLINIVPLSANEVPVAIPNVLNKIVVDPNRQNPGGYGFGVLASNGTIATVILDASASYDPDNDPLTFVWGYYDEDHFFPYNCLTNSDSPICTLPAGPPYLSDGRPSLRVYDGPDRYGETYFEVSIYTPETLMLEMLDLDEFEEVPGVHFRARNAIIVTLRKALERYYQHDVQGSIRFLRIYQRQMRAQEASVGPELAKALAGIAQTLIDSFEAFPQIFPDR